jgi:hypothetical protein
MSLELYFIFMTIQTEVLDMQFYFFSLLPRLRHHRSLSHMTRVDDYGVMFEVFNVAYTSKRIVILLTRV